MNVLIKKEVRLLLPGFCAVLLLETLLPWLFSRDADYIFSYTPVAFFLGLTILTVDSFGREFSLGTFQSLMAQPIERQKIWRTKITLLLLAIAVVTLAYAASCGLRVHHAVYDQDWRFNSKSTEADFYQAMLASVALLLVALSGGLWTSLLLRQTAPAFWVTFLFPTMLLLLLVLFLPKKLGESEQGMAALFYILAALYSLGSFWLAHRLFYRAQDVGWSGGSIMFSRWRYFERGAQAASSRRKFRPFMALLKKEFQLHSVSLICVGGLLAIHLSMFIVRAFYTSAHRDSVLNLFANGFWVFWLIVPAILGCTSAAEERKLGVMDEQFCLPTTRRRQFLIKFLPTLILGTLLGGVLPILLELAAGRLGTPNEFFKSNVHQGGYFIDGYTLFLFYIVSSAFGLALLAIWASTLAKNFLQSLSLTIVSGVLIMALAIWSVQNLILVTPLPILIGIPAGLTTLLWLTWRNFNYFQEAGSLWRRNIFGIVCGVLFIAATSAGIYFRAWEIFEPAEPPHGPAKYTLATRPSFRSQFYGEFLVYGPSGRVWYDNLGFAITRKHHIYSQWGYLMDMLLLPSMTSTGPRQFMDGSNWVSVVTRHIEFVQSLGRSKWEQVEGYLDTVGVKQDGTLWISSEAGPGAWHGSQMQQVGKETNWKKVVLASGNYLLLKTDGTLWYWGYGTNSIDWGSDSNSWLTVKNFPMRQIGTNGDCKELAQGRWDSCCIRKTDGTTWLVHYQSGTLMPELQRQTNVDQAVLATLSPSGNGQMAYVATNGVLWAHLLNGNPAVYSDPGFTQVGSDTNWVAVQLSSSWMVALNRDGTLWKWNIPNPNGREHTAPITAQIPTRLGIHNDWVGMCTTWGFIVTLAADGTLWQWPGTDHYDFALMKPPKQPQFLDTIFSTAN